MLHITDINKKAFFIAASLCVSALSHAQNVGIGIALPTEKLHIYLPAEAVTNNTLFMQAANPNGRNVIRMQNSVGNFFSISKYSPTEMVTISGVPMGGGASIINDDNGPIFISNSNYSKSMYFAANGRVNLTIDGPTGGLYVRPSKTYNFTANTETDLGIRRDTLNELQAWMEMRDSSNWGNIAGFMSTNASLDGYGPRIQFGNNSFGASKVTFWTDTYSPRMFIHENGNVGIGMPTFADPAAKLYVNGQVRVTDGNQLNGRVLTTDNSGLARWADLPGGASSWAVSGNDIYNTNSGNVGIGVNAVSHAKTIIRRLDNVSIGFIQPVSGALYAENGSSNNGSGVYGVTEAPRTGNLGYAGLTGFNNSTLTDRFGVIGQSNGTSSGGALSAGVGGYGDYGVLGYSGSNTGAGIIAQHATGKTAIEVNNGFLKVSGTNKTAFTVTATGSNSNGHILNLSYANQAETDILIVTHNYNPPGSPSAYHNANVGVYWNGGNWAIYNENTAIPIINISFNVLVIKQ